MKMMQLQQFTASAVKELNHYKAPTKTKHLD